MQRNHLRAAVAAVLLVLLAAPNALAAVGDTVTVRIEGQNATLLAKKTITLQAGTVPGNTGCAMTEVAGAIETATGGDWDRAPANYTEVILGEAHRFGDADNGYWSAWVNRKYGSGICDQELTQGDEVLITYDTADSTTFASSVFWLDLAVPTVVDRGAAVPVQATEYANYTGSTPTYGSPGVGEPRPAANIVVASGGAASATTGADGKATLTFPAVGSFTVQGTRGAERSVPVTVCVHDGNDGNCGTVKPGDPPRPPAAGPPAAPPEPVRTTATASIERNQEFTLANAPRSLSGAFDTGSTGLRAVELRLFRRHRGRCQYYSVRDERFKGTRRCSPGRYYFYKIGDQPNWEYLLPARLLAGTYYLMVTATDRNGFRSSQARKFTVG